MNRKLVSTLLLLIILVIIAVSGSAYTYYYQAGNIEDNEKELKDLKVNAQDTEELKLQLEDLKHRLAELDSILALRKYIIPVSIPQSNFFKFVNGVSSNFSDHSYVNVEYTGEGEPGDFFSYVYHSKEQQSTTIYLN
jgi:Tfp pilus assembly protein PilO